MIMQIIFKIVRVLFIAILGLLTGCENRTLEEPNIWQLQVEDFCKGILLSPDYPDSTKKLAAQTLENWANDVVDPDPVLLVAGYAEDKGKLAVFRYMYDDELNIEGITVFETCLETGETLVEEYPLFLFDTVGHVQLIFINRREASQRKDEEAWKDYVANGSFEDMWPEAFVSLPKENEIEVEIEIYDRNGNRSNRVLFRPYVRIPRPFLEEQRYREQKGLKEWFRQLMR